MNFFLRELFPHLKLKDPNLGWGKRLYIYTNIAAQLYVISWLLLYLLLPFISKQVYQIDKTAFYVDRQSPQLNNTQSYFNHVAKTIQRSVLYDPDTKANFYLVDRAIYRYMNPIEWLPHRKTFGMTLKNFVLIGDADIVNNKVYADVNISENLDAILVHEAMHILQSNKYGWFYMMYRTPYWVKEGYPIYKARPLSRHKEQELVEYLQKTQDIDIKAWDIFSQDQFYGLMIKHAIEKMHKSVDDLHLGKVSYNEVFVSLLDEYNITTSK